MMRPRAVRVVNALTEHAADPELANLRNYMNA